MVLTRYFQQYFSYILVVSFIGGGNRNKNVMIGQEKGDLLIQITA
jgi:hypothetical protein